MRAINTQDVFRLSRIIKTIDIKAELPGIVKQIEKMNEVKLSIQEDDSEEVKEQKKAEYEEIMVKVGIDIVFGIIEKCSDPKQEKAIYELLGGILEKDAKKIAEQPIKDTIEDIKQIVEENDIAVFFKLSAQLPIQ